MAEENNTDKTRQEYKTIAEETAIIFGNTLQSIASDFSKKLRDEAGTLDDLSKSLLRNFKNDLTSLSRSASSLVDIQSRMVSGSLKQQDISRAQFQLDQKLNKLFLDREMLRREGIELSAQEEKKLKDAIVSVEEQKKEYENLLKIDKEINKELGTTGALLGGIDKLFRTIGISNPFGEVVSNVKAARSQIKLNERELFKIYNSGEALTDIDKSRVKTLEAQNEGLQKQTKIGYQLGSAFKEAFNPVNIAIGLTFALIGKVIQSFGKLNKAQVDFQRNVGITADRFVLLNQNLNNSLISSVDYLEQANSLIEQFGFNAAVAFSAINTQEAAELTKLIGLSAEEANQLAYYSQANGESLKDNAGQAYKNISPLLSQKQVLQEISKVAPSIAMSFGGSAEELAKAASNARLLGLNLSQVDKIAEGLLDIESSLRSEFEAEVITGKQLNLERARFFALTNDIEGLTKEIANNQEVLNSFATGTRIEQQAIADSLGLSRDEISKMLFDQQILNKVSLEEAAIRSGMSLQDAKRLTAQESINKSIAKMTEALALPMEFMASLVSNAGILYTVMAGIGVIMTTSIVKSLAQMGVMFAGLIAKETTILGLKTGQAAAQMTTLAAATAGLGVVAALAAAGAGIAYLYNTVNKAQNVQDGIAPAEKGPFTITDSYGATAVTAKGDSLAVSPNIRREENNTTINNTRNAPSNVTVTLSKEDIKSIATAVKEGASQANINVNLDGNRLANALQTPMAMNTRKHPN